MTLIPLWLPIVLTLIFVIDLFLPDPIIFFDEAILGFLALGAWLAYFGNVLVQRAVDSVLAGNVASIIFILLTIGAVILYVRRR